MFTFITFIAVLSFLVFVHELGHFLAARHVGVRVEAFSIGFPPKLWGKHYGDTEYMISWIPLGGYVRLFGQNTDDEDLNHPENYAAKSILQRLYILAAGPAMNLLFAFIFMPLVYWVGANVPAYFSEIPLVRHVSSASFAEEVGMKEGDLILSLNQTPVSNWNQFYDSLGRLSAADSLAIEVERDGQSRVLNGSVEQLQKASEAGWKPFIAPVVGSFRSGTPAHQAGIESGDRVSNINGNPVLDWGDIRPLVQQSQALVLKDPSLKPSPQPVSVEVVRDGSSLNLEITPYWSNGAYLLGMSTATTKRSYGLMESITKGSSRVWDMFGLTLGFLGKIFQGGASMDDLGGPVRIGKAVGDAARNGISDLFFMMSMISLQLGVFNLLPIPALDGGHIFFLLIEKIKGGHLSSELRERVQIIGFSLLLGLMLFVTYNDVLQML